MVSVAIPAAPAVINTSRRDRFLLAMDFSSPRYNPSESKIEQSVGEQFSILEVYGGVATGLRQPVLRQTLFAVLWET